jgi:hypothetical protein
VAFVKVRGATNFFMEQQYSLFGFSGNYVRKIEPSPLRVASGDSPRRGEGRGEAG